MARIVVIGAGMAGLTAARRLSQGDHRLTVLEARDRVGGRVLSTTLENGAVVELGGEWLSTDQQAVIALAEELGLRLSPTELNFAERDLIGAPHIPTSNQCLGSWRTAFRPARTNLRLSTCARGIP